MCLRSRELGCRFNGTTDFLYLSIRFKKKKRERKSYRFEKAKIALVNDFTEFKLRKFHGWRGHIEYTVRSTMIKTEKTLHFGILLTALQKFPSVAWEQ